MPIVPPDGCAPFPVVSIAANVSGETDPRAQFTITTDGAATCVSTWSLAYGDATTDIGEGTPPTSTTHTYKAGLTSAVVILTLTDWRGKISATTLTIDLDNNRPVAHLVVDTRRAPTPVSVKFDGSTSEGRRSEITRWRLEFDDGSPPVNGSGIPSPTAHTFVNDTALPLVFHATLTVIDANGRVSTPTQVTVVADPPAPTEGSAPEVGLRFLRDDGRGAVTFALAFTGHNPTKWTLDAGAGTDPISGEGSPPPEVTVTVAVKEIGIEQRGVRLTVIDAAGAEKTATVILEIEGVPNPKQIPDTKAQLGETTTLARKEFDIDTDGQGGHDAF